jgi:hypothetical protein
MSTEQTGTPADLAGLLVVNPQGNDGAPPAGSDDGSPKDENRAEPDWDNAPEGDNAEGEQPEATADEGKPDEDGSAEAEEAGEQQPEGELYDVTVNGEVKKVSLKEALEGYSRQADYTRKTEEVAREREALNAELQGLRDNRAAYKQVLDTLEAQILPANREPTSDQWEQLKAEDPQRYAVEYADFQRRQDQRNAIHQERTRVATEEHTERTKALKTYVDGEREKLFAAMTHWKGADGKPDPVKVNKEIGEVREYAAKTFGYSTQELDAAYDHRLIVAFRKAMLHDKAEAARKAALGKIRNAPEVPPRDSGRRLRQRPSNGGRKLQRNSTSPAASTTRLI